MAPQRVKKQPAAQSGSLDSDVVASFPVPPSSAAATPNATTPSRSSPSKQKITITEQQKQALMDNLQLEITERARKLRSQYGLLAQGLRSRLEMRVNRIPTALRKTNILDLVEKYSEQPRTEPPTSTIARPTPSVLLEPPAPTETSLAHRRGIKRNSEELDQENEQYTQKPEQELAMPKKRTKTTANQKKGPPAANSRARTVSRQDQPLQVLSPKSNNSRTYPRSPLKIAEDEKSAPKSPLKSSVLSPDDKAAAGAGRGKKAVTTAAQEKKTTRLSIASSNGSAATDTTTGTTIVKKKTTAATGAKKTARSAAPAKSAAAKATAAAKRGKENAPAGTGGRSLRTRTK
ncbi:Borealin N terminal-domain-containing protein [Macrophomina phaseolina]|uniref:Borealin N terminal-domain-containing protein n=1 Tax=Macrophomina phaseolina TaxID=35725 RepID=A0ABQ8GMA3_9PEZI|nr:Borealin N terminal-domain-containing protein [Macrophomina phaseolina]